MKMSNTQTVIISGFPGTGKSEFVKNFSEKYSILDSDSSEFSWVIDDKGHKRRNKDFPDNYIKHIKNNIGKVDIIMVSSHDIVRKALAHNGIKYILMFPNVDCKDIYIQRYINRGNDSSFIDMIKQNWYTFNKEMKSEKFPKKIEMIGDTFISDYIDTILKK